MINLLLIFSHIFFLLYSLSCRLGNEKYKSKTTPRAKWLEQFDLHLFDEDQQLEVVVCTKNANIGKCVIDLRSLPRETTHRLWNKFEDCLGEIFLLLTISGTTASETISDLTTHRENEIERRNLDKKYVMSLTYVWLMAIIQIKPLNSFFFTFFRHCIDFIRIYVTLVT